MSNQGQTNGNLNEALDYLTNYPFGNGENFGYSVSELQSVIQFVNTSSFKVDKSKITLGGHSMSGWTEMKVMEDGFRPIAMFFFSMGALNWLYNQNRYFKANTFNVSKLQVCRSRLGTLSLASSQIDNGIILNSIK